MFLHRHYSMQQEENLPQGRLNLHQLFPDMDFTYKNYQCDDRIEPYSRDFFVKCGAAFSFSKDYFHSRERFRNLSKSSQLETFFEYVYDKNEDLTIDFSLIKGKDPSKLLIYFCGIHGVESYTGSSIIINILMQYKNKTLLNNKELMPTILFVHGYNPFGFAKHRRVNKNNVDLNRNVLLTKKEWNQALNRDHNIVGYEDLKEYIFNISPDQSWMDTLKWGCYITYYYIIKGKSFISKAFITGQYHDEKGVYYGGNQMQNEHKIFYKLIVENKKLNIYNLDKLKQVIIVDIHSGLGVSGLDTLMVDTVKEYQFIKSVIPSNIYNVSSGRLDITFAQNTNHFGNTNFWDYSLMTGATANWCKIFTKKMNNINIDKDYNKEMMEYYKSNIGPIDDDDDDDDDNDDDDSMKLIKDFNIDIDCVAITQEFGTKTGAQVFRALINENVMTQKKKKKKISHQSIQKSRNNLRDAFYIDSDEWRTKVIWNGINLFEAISRL